MYRDRQKEHVKCRDCRKGMAEGSLEAYFDDTAWEVKGGQVKLDRHSHGRGDGTTHLSDRVPYQGGDEGMPSRGLPGEVRDTDGDEGSFLAPACPGCRDQIPGWGHEGSRI